MPVIVEWYDVLHRILHYRFEGAWTWDEYYVALAQGRMMEKDAAHAVGTLNDMRQTKHLPDDFIESAHETPALRHGEGVRLVLSSRC